MKILKSMTVPREKPPKKEVEGISDELTKTQVEDSGADEKGNETEEDLKPDFMIPLSFQSDMGHIHQKAGFTVGGE